MKVIYVMGKTCVGKSTLIQKACEHDSRVGACEVGKEFRRRYPPGHFKGLGAMPDTEKEALEILDMFFTKARNERKEIVLVDGQPRAIEQLKLVMGRHSNRERVWWCHVPDEVCEERARDRFLMPNGDFDNEGYNLAIKRINNDAVQLYPVLWHLVTRYSLPILGVELVDGFDYDVFFRYFLER